MSAQATRGANRRLAKLVVLGLCILIVVAIAFFAIGVQRYSGSSHHGKPSLTQVKPTTP